mgnify:CR=1 FL=1
MELTCNSRGRQISFPEVEVGSPQRSKMPDRLLPCIEEHPSPPSSSVVAVTGGAFLRHGPTRLSAPHNEGIWQRHAASGGGMEEVEVPEPKTGRASGREGG